MVTEFFGGDSYRHRYPARGILASHGTHARSATCALVPRFTDFVSGGPKYLHVQSLDVFKTKIKTGSARQNSNIRSPRTQSLHVRWQLVRSAHMIQEVA